MKPAAVYWRAICATWRALRRKGKARPRAETSKRTRARMRSRKRAALRLGGACACCGLGLDFAYVFEFHHVRGNGTQHRALLRALSTGVTGWILAHPSPRSGLFALELLCVVCHRMHHEAGACPHRKGVRLTA